MSNWYCNNCNTYKDSWAEHQSYKPDETYRRDIRCWSCDKWELIYTESQIARYKELVKQRSFVVGSIEEVERFSTWWSNNIATVVNYYKGYYRVFILVYNPVYSDKDSVMFPADSFSNYWGENKRGNHEYFSSAKYEAKWLRDQLTSSSSKYYDNPILLVHPYCNNYRSFNTFVDRSYVAKREIGSGSSSWCVVVVVHGGWTPSNLDNHFRPLDIVKIEKRDIIFGKIYYHVGIYLGKDSICHISDPNGLISEENIKARITSWDTFLKGRTGEMYRYNPVVPFKHYAKSIEQAVKAYWADYGEGKYDLYNDNCEHFANAIVYGIYHSEQIENYSGLDTFIGKVWDSAWNKQHNFFWKLFQPKHWSTLWREIPIINLVSGRTFKTNNKYPGESRNICLKDEINSWNTNGKFNNLTSSDLRSRREEYERQYLQEVPPKQDCRIM